LRDERLSDIAWKLFAGTRPAGLASRPSATTFMGHIAFGYMHARPTKTAWEAFNES
jgi:hypothetical protein